MSKQMLWAVALGAMFLGFGVLASAAEPGGVRSLEEFGDISTVEGAEEALERAFEELMASGGGIVEIPANAPEELKVSNNSQTEKRGPGVTVIDYRDGFVTFHPPSMGKNQDGVWGGVRINRELNLVNRNLGHCSTHSVQSIHNNVISGASSYMATLTEPVKKGKDRRCYVDLIRGIWVGQYLNITGKEMGYGKPYDKVTVKGIDWDDEKKCNYFVADLEHDHPRHALVYNKDNVNGLVIDTYSNCDNQTAGQLWVKQHQYSVGDNFTISGWLGYMSDVFCGFGDEGAVVLNAETIGEIDGFHSSVESVDWSRDEITYAPGIVNAHTLSNSRPLINMNRDKWITEGTVNIVPPDKPYKGKTYPEGLPLDRGHHWTFLHRNRPDGGHSSPRPITGGRLRQDAGPSDISLVPYKGVQAQLRRHEGHQDTSGALVCGGGGCAQALRGRQLHLGRPRASPGVCNRTGGVGLRCEQGLG